MSLQAKMTALADAVRLKSGASGLLSIEGMTKAINSISEGGCPQYVDDEKIWFIDYDGTVIDCWDLSELSEKTALPGYPSHDGLVAEGWNWTLDQIKAHAAPAVVGQLYTTDDGHMRIQIELGVRRSVYFKYYFAGTASVDWGDGTSSGDLSSEGYQELNHSYASGGLYTISVSASAKGFLLYRIFFYDTASSTPVNQLANTFVKNLFLADNFQVFSNGLEGCAGLETISVSASSKIQSFALKGCCNLKALVLPSTMTQVHESICENCSALQAVSVGSAISIIRGSAFAGCSALRTFSWNSGIEQVESYAFEGCKALPSINLNAAYGEVGAYAFQNCYTVRKATLPTDLVSLESGVFKNCASLEAFLLPGLTDTILSDTFTGCSSMKKLTLNPYEDVGMVAVMTGALDSFPKDCKVIVPKGTLDTYKADEAWSAYADMLEEAT